MPNTKKYADAELDTCINKWDNCLFHDRFLLSSATLYIVEATSALLKELKVRRETETKS